MASYSSLFVFFALVTASLAGEGPCRYDPELCSCKLGQSNQGVCWDKIAGDTETCTARTCNAGWTCACGGRTHVCHVGNLTSYQNSGSKVTLSEVITGTQSVVSFSARQAANPVTRPCSKKINPTAVEPDILLGTVDFSISEVGALENQCNILAWFHNGVILGNYQKPSSVSSDNLQDVLNERRNHTLLELRPGDLIAFRFKEASYYCYKHMTKFTINGRTFDSTAAGFETRFAREHTKGWELPSFQPVLEEVETTQNLPAFLPLREKMVPVNEQSSTFGPAISAGEDLWEAPKTPQDENHKVSNFYYRITFPQVMPPIEA